MQATIGIEGLDNSYSESVTLNNKTDSRFAIVKDGGFGQPVVFANSNGSDFVGLEYPTGTSVVKQEKNGLFSVNSFQYFGHKIEPKSIESNWEVTAVASQPYAKKWFYTYVDAIRVAPAYDNGTGTGLVYFGSDDGQAYCVNGTTGAQVWSYRGGASDTMITSDHKFLTRYPCRTGVLVQGGSAYCGFGLLTWHTNSMVKLNATTGAEENKTSNSGASYSFEGPLLADASKLFVTQGRNAPRSFSLSNVASAGSLSGCGGTFATISAGGSIFHGPGHRGTRADHMQESNASSNSAGARHNFVSRILVDGSDRYSLVRDAVQASGGVTWTQGIDKPVTLIKGGTTLYVGGHNQVVALDSATGATLKVMTVDGDAYSLAIANGKLFVSTHAGKVYCFE